MNERIKEIRKRLGLSQEEFGKRLGVTRGAITNIELNKVDPKPLFVDLICKEFNVSDTWLRTGEGEMFIPMTEDEELVDVLADLQVDEKNPVRKLLIAYWRLTDEQKDVIKQMIQNLIDMEKEKAGQ